MGVDPASGTQGVRRGDDTAIVVIIEVTAKNPDDAKYAELVQKMLNYDIRKSYFGHFSTAWVSFESSGVRKFKRALEKINSVTKSNNNEEQT